MSTLMSSTFNPIDSCLFVDISDTSHPGTVIFELRVLNLLKVKLFCCRLYFSNENIFNYTQTAKNISVNLELVHFSCQ